MHPASMEQQQGSVEPITDQGGVGPFPAGDWFNGPEANDAEATGYVTPRSWRVTEATLPLPPDVRQLPPT